MASINTTQEQEVTFLTGVNQAGTLVSQSFWSWNDDTPATYGPETFAAKWGSGAAGSPGGVVTYAFTAASNWTVAEKNAFTSVMDLWSAVANISFAEQPEVSAKVTITRTDTDGASGGFAARLSDIGSTSLGSARSGTIRIDTGEFGPLGSTLGNYGGFPWKTLIHEIGHVIGLGHGGPYNVGDADANVYTAFDSSAWTVMSYNDAGATGDGMSYRWGTSVADDGLTYRNGPTTWMPLDIAAIQRLYGAAVNTPLSGGQTYGFNSNIQGSIAKFFDFTQNARPVVTLWNKGTGNSLDLSGFSQGSTVDLHDGAFSSAAGLTNNIAIAFGTRIDTVVTGSGNDRITLNDNSDYAMGGTGADAITGGSGNDHLYGASSTGIAGDGGDTINAGAGSDYLQGNAGEDQLDGGAGSDRIQGGQGNDDIAGGSDNDSVNGNLGNDSIDGGNGNDSLRGGQGSDSLRGGGDNDMLFGDLGADTLAGGIGIDMLTGGADSDLFSFAAGDAAFSLSGALARMTDAIVDFTDGVDRIRLFATPGNVLHDGSFASFDAAAAVAEQALRSQGFFNNVDAIGVGGDTYIFYVSGSGAPLEAVKLAGFANPNAITAADFI